MPQNNQLDSLRRKFAPDGDAPVGILGLSVVRGSIKAADPKNPDDVVCVATTDFTDMDDEVLMPGGADMSYFAENRTLFVDHDYGVESAVAKLRSVVPYPDITAMRGWRVRCSLIKGSKYEQTVRRLAAEGILGCSVGLKALDWGPLTPEEKKVYPAAKSIVRKWRWLELSFTSMPCNVKCRLELSCGDGEKPKAVRKVFLGV